MVHGVALKLPVVADVGDPLSAGTRHRVRIGAFAGGQLLHRSVLHGKGVNVSAFQGIVGVGNSIGGDVNPFAVGRPGESAALGTAVVVIAAGDLFGRAAGRGNCENVGVAGLQNALAVGGPAELGDHDG